MKVRLILVVLAFVFGVVSCTDTSNYSAESKAFIKNVRGKTFKSDFFGSKMVFKFKHNGDIKYEVSTDGKVNHEMTYSFAYAVDEYKGIYYSIEGTLDVTTWFVISSDSKELYTASYEGRMYKKDELYLMATRK